MKLNFNLKTFTLMLAGLIFVSMPVCMGMNMVADVPHSNLLMERSNNITRLTMDEYGTMGVPGQPRLPSRIVAVAVPPGAEVESVSVTSQRQVVLGEGFVVEPVSLRLPLMTLTEAEKEPFLVEYENNVNTIFSQDSLWPEAIGEVVREAAFRKYQLVDVRINPVQYNPVTGQLIEHQGIEIHVNYDLSEQSELIVDWIPEMEDRASDIIVNYVDAQEWYHVQRAGSRDNHDFVIVTTASLVDSVQPLVEFLTNVKNRTVYTATVEDIEATGSGTDTMEKIRNFLRERYPSSSWGIQDVLVVGDYSGVPMRRVEQDAGGYGKPQTDFYYAELSSPDNQGWDSNGNGQYWDNQDQADFYAEVNIGRIPWSDPEIVSSICTKSMNFEMLDDPSFKNNILLCGSFFWEDTDNAVLMEYIMDQPHMNDWTATRMYEQNSTVYSNYECDYELRRSTTQTVWPEGNFAFANLAGHGSYQSVHIMGYGSESFWNSNMCSSLSDEYPSIVFADACSTSDTAYTNLGAKMLEQGAVGYVGATKVAYGSNNWQDPSDGSTQTLDYYFTNFVTTGENSQGASHQMALTETYQTSGFYYPKYEIAEWNLWGNPDLGMGLAIGSNASIAMDRAVYAPNDTLAITLRDMDLNTTGNPDTATVTVTTNGNDSESVTVTETDTPGVFSGTIALAESNSVAGNQRLDVLHGQIVTVSYTDEDNGSGGVNILKTATADVDGVEPEIINLTFSRITSDMIELSWETTELTTCSVDYGEVDLIKSATSMVPETEHTVILSELLPCTYYFFVIHATDLAGNAVTDDNGGIYYRTHTKQKVIAYSLPLDTDPGWSIEGEWEFGQPLGQGGSHGHPDPTAGKTGTNVYGYNLDGDYPDNSPAYNLTTTPFDCSTLDDVKLTYWRYLGVERNLYDKAKIQVSVDGSSFATIWENPDIETADSDWVYHELDISDMADGQSAVWIRWVMGSTDGGWHYCGWNIDDIELSSTGDCNMATPTPRPTATPEPPQIPATGIHLTMADTSLQKDDTFDLKYCLRNGMKVSMNVDMFIALEVYGAFWFYPTWTSMEDGIDFVPEMIVPAASEMSGTVLNFVWPDVGGQAPGLFFYGLLLDHVSGAITGDLTSICWEYR